MNRTTVGLSLAVIMLLATPSWAAIKPESLSVGIFGGDYMFQHPENLHVAPVYGLKVGYDFTKFFGLEISGEGLQTKIRTDYRAEGVSNRINSYNARLDSLIYLMPDSAFVPYVSVGVGGRTLEDQAGDTYRRHFLADVGLGAKMFITDRVALRGDIRSFFFDNDYQALGDNDKLHNFQNFEGMMGIMVVMGGKKPLVDSDNDGVYDNKDQCPDTPAGVQVDANGCPVDSDKDGVADYLDKCPDTPAGVKVDSTGCPLDSDNDGVADYLDQCPNTPAGVKVDKVGCPIPVVTAPKPAPVPVPAPSVMEQAIVEKGRATLDIKFNTGKADILPKYREELVKFADIMKKHPDLKVVIEGHTDIVGGFKYNQKLSQRRADSVKAYLVSKCGIDATRLSSKGYGDTKPIADNKTAAGKLKNRRVEAAVEYSQDKAK